MADNEGILPSRGAVPEIETWDLSGLYRDFEAWDADMASLPTGEKLRAMTAPLAKMLSESASAAAEVLLREEEIDIRLERLSVYVRLRESEDEGAPAAQTRRARLDTAAAEIEAAFAFVEPTLLANDDLGTWVSTPELAPFQRRLTKLLAERQHVLSEKEEALLARLSPIFQTFDNVHSKWLDVDLSFPEAVDGSGVAHHVSHASWGVLSSSPDGVLRRSAYESLFGEYAKARNWLAENLTAAFRLGATEASLRGYRSFRHMSLADDEIPEAVYDTLLEQVGEHAEARLAGVALRREALGTERLHLADRTVPLGRAPRARLSWDDAVELVLAAVEPLGADYVKKARHGLTAGRWVDRCVNEGKHSGAFSWGFYGGSPVMSLTWDGTMDSLFTLAHELGHSMHTLLANEAQPYRLAGYSIFVAEVASTLNEVLLANHLIAHRPDLAEEALSYKLMGFELTVLRQAMFAAFESRLASAIEAGADTTGEAIEEMYAGLVREWFGPDLDDSDEHHGLGWTEIPHFYDTFYVYKYATSYCAALALAERLATDPDGGRAAVYAMLSAGGAIPPLEIMRGAGVDYLSGSMYRAAFSAYARDVERARLAFLGATADRASTGQ